VSAGSWRTAEDARLSTSWAIGPLVSAGLVVGYSAFELVNRETGRAHLLHIPTVGIGTPWGSAGGGLPDYTMFETKRKMNFDGFSGLEARLTSANATPLYGYSITYLTLAKRMFETEPVIYVKMAGWGLGIPSASVGVGLTVITYGAGRTTGTVPRVLVPEPDEYIPEPRLVRIAQKAFENKRMDVPTDYLFAFDSDVLSQEATPSLLLLADLLNNRLRRRVVIQGHTDGRGSSRYNLNLSRRRAQAVKDWFVLHRVYEAAQFHVQALGESQPLEAEMNANGSDRPEGRRANRRVTVLTKWLR
jgi:outer membrane protein OmpA-like peptidoglycan-associated protein